MHVFSQTYNDLWKQYDEAVTKDLPKTQTSVLDKIIKKATNEGAYGHLMKAELRHVASVTSVTPDSLQAEVEKIVERAQQVEGNPVLSAIYNSVLGEVYSSNRQLTMESDVNASDFFKKSLEQPELLAAQKVKDFDPLFESGEDSKWFDNDLLHVLGYKAGEYQLLHDYYDAHGNRNAACLTAAMIARRKADTIGAKATIAHVDSLMNVYADTEVAGELAIIKYEQMGELTKYSTEDKIKYIDEAVAKYGSWKRINQLKNSRESMIEPRWNIDFGQQVVLPGKPRMVEFNNVRHTDKITLTINRVDVPATESYYLYNEKTLKEVKSHIVKNTTVTLTKEFLGKKDFELSKDSLELPALTPGVYLAEVTSDGSKEMTKHFLFYVSDIFVLTQQQPKNQLRLAVVSATTGQPIPKAKVKIDFNRYSNKKDDLILKLTCDEKGEVIINQKKDYSERPDIFAYTDNDKYCPDQSLWVDNYNVTSGTTHDMAYIYTDRSIYRPGQTVHAAILIGRLENSSSTKAIEDRKLTVSLLDANSKTIEEKEVVTDAYGKASVDFVLPKQGLTGIFRIRTNRPNESQSFRVEEYKRPTFQVEFPTVTEAYADGDTIEVKGYAKTYAGVPVQGAKVEYTVERRHSWWWRWFDDPEEDDPVLAEEETVTDDNGMFVMRVPIIIPKSPDGDDAKKSSNPRFYSFEANAKVTDVAGETHEGHISLPLGTKPTVLSCEVPDKELADSLKFFRFSRRNASGTEIDGDVRYRIDNGKEYRAKANTKIELTQKLSSGKHTIIGICENDTAKAEFVVFTLDDKKPATETHDWFYITDNVFPEDGSPVRIQLGSSDPDVHVLYSFIADDRVIKSGTLELNNSNYNLSIPYNDSYGDGVVLTFAWVKEGKMYEHVEQIRKPLPDKRILLKWTTFRDRLVPGQEEEWTLSAMRPDGTPADAQLIATLYDKSLDQIYQHHWPFYLGIQALLPYTEWNGFRFSDNTYSANKGFRSLVVPYLSYYHFDEGLFDFWMPRYYRHTNGRSRRLSKALDSVEYEEVAMLGSAAGVVMEAEVADTKVYSIAEVKEATNKKQQFSGSVKQGNSDEIQIRENLDETAFFMPVVVTDANGNLSLKFRLPESVTTWHFMGLATDRQLNYGQISGDAVAKKDVMIQPNMPRFVRVGDNAKLSARIMNTSESDLTGTAVMTLLDPETEQEVYRTTQPFSVKAGQTTKAVFDYQPQGNGTMLICRMTASANGVSDGEQHYLPILPNKELVTRTKPFTQHGPQLTSIDLNTLFPKGSSDGKLTVEYTNNPAWLMVQALPSMGITNSDNAISQAASFYANSIASHLLHLSPNIKTTIEEWNKETIAESSLMSSLAKNEELKDLLLNETPWVGDADKEEQQKRDLINLFDQNNLDNRLGSAIKKLNNLQHSDGSWAWCPGMKGNVYVTASVTEMLVRLNRMIGEQSNATNMLDKSVKYLGKYLVKEADEMKKAEKKGFKVRPSETAIDILYTFALDGRQQPTKVQDAQKYMVNILAKKTTEFTIYGKAVAAIILAHNGKKAKAEEYLQSINEYSVATEEMGRYFDTRKAYYSWFDYAIPTEVAAIEAIKMLQPSDTLTVEEMRRWLLQAKRTQSWDTPINSANAVYAFLEGNVGSLDQQVQSTLAVDGRTIDTSDATAGLGYVKAAMSNDGLRELTVKKESEGTSWGAIYAQFMQPVDEVENFSAGITVRREVLAPSTTLHVGDRVTVRITIKADRDYDFVEVIDRRAACMEPVKQLSTYQMGYYISTKDYTTNYYFDMLGKGTHVVETEYYIDREGTYETGTCKVQCAYAPEFSATGKALKVEVK